MNADRFFYGVARVGAEGRDALFAVFDRSDGAEVEDHLPGVSGFNLGALARGAEQLKPTFGLDLGVDGLRLVQVVAQDDGERNLVAFGQDFRRVVFGEEGLEGAELLFGDPDLAVNRRTDDRHLPGRDVVGELEFQMRAALLVGFDLRLPEQRFGEVFAQTRSRNLILRNRLRGSCAGARDYRNFA